MNPSSAFDSDQHTYLAKVARLYYIHGMNQRDIAQRFHTSVASVSRALRRAKELRIVEFTIDEPNDSFGDLEVLIENTWNVTECSIVPRTESLQSIYRAMAGKLTEIFSRIVEDGDTVGVSWGATLKNMSELMGPVRRNNVSVIPIIGAMGKVETGIYPNSIAKEFAAKLGGTTYLMNTPAIVDTEETRDRLHRDSSFQLVREKWEQLRVVVFSVSGVDEETSAFESGVFTRGVLSDIRSRGGVCATNFTIVDASGTPLDLPISRRITNLSFGALASIPETVVIATGERKIEPLRATLRAGVIRRLITDETCASALVDSNDPNRGRRMANFGTNERSPVRGDPGLHPRVRGFHL